MNPSLQATSNFCNVIGQYPSGMSVKSIATSKNYEMFDYSSVIPRKIWVPSPISKLCSDFNIAQIPRGTSVTGLPRKYFSAARDPLL